MKCYTSCLVSLVSLVIILHLNLAIDWFCTPSVMPSVMHSVNVSVMPSVMLSVNVSLVTPWVILWFFL